VTPHEPGAETSAERRLALEDDRRPAFEAERRLALEDDYRPVFEGDRRLAFGDDYRPAFEELMATVMTSAGRFGHRQHVHLTWLAVRRCGLPAAITVVSEGIQRTARYAGVPQKYHATVSRAWVELVGHHALESGEPLESLESLESRESRESREDGFAAFADRNPALLDKRLLTRHYRPSTLASPQAKTGWVEPDLVPFPWHEDPHSA
jgi:hypothetical protein